MLKKIVYFTSIVVLILVAISSNVTNIKAVANTNLSDEIPTNNILTTPSDVEPIDVYSTTILSSSVFLCTLSGSSPFVYAYSYTSAADCYVTLSPSFEKYNVPIEVQEALIQGWHCVRGYYDEEGRAVITYYSNFEISAYTLGILKEKYQPYVSDVIEQLITLLKQSMNE
jgi:hypothetical protein